MVVLNNEWVENEEFSFLVLVGILFEICIAKHFAFWQIFDPACLFVLCFLKIPFRSSINPFLIVKFSTIKVG